MMKKQIIYDFVRAAEPKQTALTRDVLKNMTDHPVFEPLNGQIGIVQKAFDEWQVAAAEAQSRDRNKVFLKNEKRKACMSQLYRLAMEVNLLANGNEEIAVASGLPLRTTRQKVTEIPTPQIKKIVRLENSGCVELRWSKERGVIAFALESSIDHGQTWVNGKYCKSTKKRMEGFTPGVETLFRVKALGSDVESDWSPPAAILMT